jgi:hypothetical protein
MFEGEKTDRRIFITGLAAGFSGALLFPPIADIALAADKQPAKLTATPTPTKTIEPTKVMDQSKPVGPYLMKWIPKGPIETKGPVEILMDVGLHQGDMLFIKARKLWVGTSGANVFDQTAFKGGLVLAAIRAVTDIKDLPFTVYGDLQFPMSGEIEPVRSKTEPDQQRDFANLIRQKVEDLRVPGRGCLVGCANIRFASFNAVDVVQPSGATILQLRRTANPVFMS